MNTLKSILLLILCLSVISGCKKEDEYANAEFSVSTGTVLEQNGNYALASGKLRMTSGKVSSYGHCWSEYPGPTIENDAKTDHGPQDETIEFTSAMKDLEPGKLYYTRAYAVGSAVQYGTEYPVYTPSLQVSGVSIMNMTTEKAQLEAWVEVFAGAAAIYGFCWSQEERPTIYDDKKEFLMLPDHGYFNAEITDFAPKTKYYVRAYAQGELIAYGPVKEIYLNNIIVTNTEVEQNTETQLTLSANLDFNGATIIEHGHCWSLESNPDLNDDHTSFGAAHSSGMFQSEATDLQTNSTYYIRAYAQTADTLIYSDESSFKLAYPHSIATFSGPARQNAKAFVLNGIPYIGFGETENFALEDFWKYSVEDRTWTEVAEYPINVAKYRFALNDHGYGFNYVSKKVFTHQYQPSTDEWTELETLELGYTARDLYSFSYDGRLFLSLVNTSQNNDLYIYEYRKSSDRWEFVSQYNSELGTEEFVFIIDSKVYFMCPHSPWHFKAYDIESNSWAELQAPNNYYYDEYPTSFEMNGKGYLQDYNDVVRYIPESNKWEIATSCMRTLTQATPLKINSAFFLGLGFDWDGYDYNLDFELYQDIAD